MISKKYYWPGMWMDITDYVSTAYTLANIPACSISRLEHVINVSTTKK